MRNRTKKFGILLHPTSFPSPHGIGDLGKEAREVLDCFAEMGVKLWQILPLGPTGFGDSPYTSRSTFAGNEYLIDLRSIEGINGVEIWESNSFESVDYDKVYNTKLPVLKLAAKQYHKTHKDSPEFKKFVKDNAFWLKDYALFMALTNYYNDSRWYLWDEGLRDRKPESLRRWSLKLRTEINTYVTLQFLFYKQWNELHKYANKLGIQIIGDLPMNVAMDSSDVWTHKHLFKIDDKGKIKACAGVPPDGFCQYGQLWGNPVYDWPVHEKEKYSWFRKRINNTLKLVDILRIDHFRGFESYWEIPGGSKDAVNGKWVKGPGMKLLKYFKGERIIVEDLGFITEEVKQLVRDTSWPSMKVIQLGVEVKDGKLDSTNEYLPHNYSYNCVAYTGTHDNNTSRGWYDSLSDDYKNALRKYFECPDEDIVWQMVRILIMSSAKYTVVPIQDILGLDGSGRMNTPSTVGKYNWSYRYNPSQLQDWMKNRLKEMLELYGRTGK